MTTLRRHLHLLLICVAALGSAPAFAGGSATPFGPTPYLSAADSPFPLGTGSFCGDRIRDDARTLRGMLDCAGG
jgi:hypothetical protein